jgi:hypothetical protein
MAVVIPLLIGIIVWELALTSYVDGLWLSLFPFSPSLGILSRVLESRELLDLLRGVWWFLPCSW